MEQKGKTENPPARPKKKFELDPLAHPQISGFAIGMGVFMHTHSDVLSAISDDPAKIIDNPLAGLLLGIYSFVGYNMIRPLSKLSGPNRIASYLKLCSLSARTDKHLEDNEYWALGEEIKKCFDPSTHSDPYVSSWLHFRKGNKMEGIEDMLRYARHFKSVPRTFPRNPYSDIANLAVYGYKLLVDAEFSRTKNGNLGRYEQLLITFNSGVSRWPASFALEKIIQDPDLEDTVAYGAVKDYLHNPNDDNWAPFMRKLDEISEGDGIERYLVDVTEGRNPVYKLPGLYLKEYGTAEDRDVEMHNLKVVFKNLKHVLSHGIAAEIDGKHCFIAPDSGKTLFEAAKGMSRETLEEMLGKALTNLSEIQSTAASKDQYPPVSADHYTSRIARLDALLPTDEDFLETWDSAISKPLASMDQLFYKDSNLKNYLLEDDLLFEIDFESQVKKAAPLELINITEFERAYMDDNEELRLHYLESLKDAGLDVSISRKDYELCRAQRHIELLGYRHRDLKRSEKDSARTYEAYHLMSAIEALSNVSSMAHPDPGCPYLASRLESSVEDIL